MNNDFLVHVTFGYGAQQKLMASAQIDKTIAPSRVLSHRAHKHPLNINTWKENGGAHGNNPSESPKLKHFMCVLLFMLKAGDDLDFLPPGEIGGV